MPFSIFLSKGSRTLLILALLDFVGRQVCFSEARPANPAMGTCQGVSFPACECLRRFLKAQPCVCVSFLVDAQALSGCELPVHMGVVPFLTVADLWVLGGFKSTPLEGRIPFWDSPQTQAQKHVAPSGRGKRTGSLVAGRRCPVLSGHG